MMPKSTSSLQKQRKKTLPPYEEKIIDFIRQYEGAVTWEKVNEMLLKNHKIKFSRASFNNNQKIKDAYKEAKEASKFRRANGLRTAPQPMQVKYINLKAKYETLYQVLWDICKYLVKTNDASAQNNDIRKLREMLERAKYGE